MNKKFAVWSEFTPYHEIPPLLDELKHNDVSLYLAIHENTLYQESLYHLLGLAQSKGVEVKPWLLLDKSKGYWPNKWNFHHFRELCFNFLSECEKRLIKNDWIIVDMEPHIDLLLSLEELLKGKHFISARKLIFDWAKRKDLKLSQKEISDFINDLHKKNIKVHVVTMPMILDDILLKKQKLQQALGIPIEELPWDEVSFMVYRPYFWDYLPGMSSAIVRSYAQDALKNFGEKASLALGPIGSPMVTKSQNFYKEPSYLNEDIAAGEACKIERFSLFSLEGIREQGKLKDFTSTNIVQQSPQFSIKAYLLRKVICLGIKFFL